MIEATSALGFDVLLKRVLDYWPESIDVTKLHIREDRPEFYSVAHLGRLNDSIVQSLEGEGDAVLLIAMSEAIKTNVRLSAIYFTQIKPALLRASTIRLDFEKRLHRYVSNPELGWIDDDLLLIKRYFAENI